MRLLLVGGGHAHVQVRGVKDGARQNLSLALYADYYAVFFFQGHSQPVAAAEPPPRADAVSARDNNMVQRHGAWRNREVLCVQCVPGGCGTTVGGPRRTSLIPDRGPTKSRCTRKKK